MSHKYTTSRTALGYSSRRISRGQQLREAQVGHWLVAASIKLKMFIHLRRRGWRYSVVIQPWILQQLGRHRVGRTLPNAVLYEHVGYSRLLQKDPDSA